MSLELNIRIEYRKPRDRAEAKIFGRTSIQPQGNIATVFINSAKSGRNGEALNTFFHELTHVWNDMMGAQKMGRKDDEHSASMVGDTVEALLKCYLGR
jgi:hypothetical protein